MLESGAWLHISFGFVLGGVSVFYALSIWKLLVMHDKIYAYFNKIARYTLAVSLFTFIYSAAIIGGILEEWQPLGFPLPLSEKPVKILDIGYVQSTSGSIYHWTDPHSYEGNWEKVEEIATDPNYPIYDSCSSVTLWFLPIHKSDFIDYKKACIDWGPGKSTVAFAIGGSGQAYLWFHGTGEMDSLLPITFAFWASSPSKLNL